MKKTVANVTIAVLCLLMAACSGTAAKESSSPVAMDQVEVSGMEEKADMAEPGVPEPIEYSNINKFCKITDTGDTLEIDGHRWKLSGHVLTISLQEGMSNWDAYRLENEGTAFLRKWLFRKFGKSGL